MATIPTERSPDSSVAFLRDGYRFVGRRCDRHGTDIFQARLLLEPTICLRGRAAAELFYDTERFVRAGAMPKRAQRTLTGRGGVQGLDGADHADRKAMFMSIMTPTAVRQLAQLFDDEWRARVPSWESGKPVVLLRRGRPDADPRGLRLGRRAARELEVDRRTAEMHAMIEGPAALGPQHWRGLWGRRGANAGSAEVVDRSARRHAPRTAGAARCGWSPSTATPTGGCSPAGSRPSSCSTCCGPRSPSTATSSSPPWPCTTTRPGGTGSAGDEAAECFVQEVRRYYPFFPVASARVRRPFEWQGHHFPTRPPGAARPVRHQPSSAALAGAGAVPPGAVHRLAGRPVRFRAAGRGQHLTGHRCAGEWITIELMKRAVTNLTTTMRYDVPPQDLALVLRRMPALPPSGFLVTNVRRTAERDAAPGTAPPKRRAGLPGR